MVKTFLLATLVALIIVAGLAGGVITYHRVFVTQPVLTPMDRLNRYDTEAAARIQQRVQHFDDLETRYRKHAISPQQYQRGFGVLVRNLCSTVAPIAQDEVAILAHDAWPTAVNDERRALQKLDQRIHDAALECSQASDEQANQALLKLEQRSQQSRAATKALNDRFTQVNV